MTKSAPARTAGLLRLAGLFTAALAGILALAACAGTPAAPQAGGGPEADTAQEKAAEPQAADTETAPDYLQEGEVLASPDDGSQWELGTRLVAAAIQTEATEETKGEYQVAMAYGTFDWAEGDTRWTQLVIPESHPASKEELEKGMTLLAADRDNELRTASWRLVKVTGLDNLYKGMVTVQARSTNVGGGIEEESRPLKALRIIDRPDITLPGDAGDAGQAGSAD